MGRGYPQPTRGGGGLGEHRMLPSGGRGGAQRKTILLLSKRVMQCLLKIKVVHSRPLVEKNWFAQWIGSGPLRQPSQLPRKVLQFRLALAIKVDKIDLERSIELLNANNLQMFAGGKRKQ